MWSLWSNWHYFPVHLPHAFAVTLHSWRKAHYPSTSSQQATLQNINTWQWRSPPQIPADVRLINRPEHESTFQSQKLETSLWALLPSVHCSRSEQNLMRLQVFIPPEGLDLHRLCPPELEALSSCSPHTTLKHPQTSFLLFWLRHPGV